MMYDLIIRRVRHGIFPHNNGNNSPVWLAYALIYSSLLAFLYYLIIEIVIKL